MLGGSSTRPPWRLLNRVEADDRAGQHGHRASCSLRNRLDYILLSPELAGAFTGGEIFRKGLWGTPTNKNPPTAWTVFPEITAGVHAASDHAAVWVELNL